MKCKLCVFSDVKISLEHVFCVQFLEVRNDLLVHGLEDRGGVKWEVQHLNKLELLQDIIFKTGWVGRGIIKNEEVLERRLFSSSSLNTRAKNQIDPLNKKLSGNPGFGTGPP